MLQFKHPVFLLCLWLVPVLPLIWLYIYSRSEKRLEAFIAGYMQKRLRRPVSTLRLNLQAWLTAAGVILLILAAAGPHWGRQEQRVSPFGRDIVILLDVSRSMLAGDLEPNRLEWAKTAVQELVSKLDSDRIALVAFRHKAVTLCPLTRDHHFLREAIEGAGPGSAPRGETDIAAAIMKGMELPGGDASGCGAIVLLSDGEGMTGGMEEALRRARAAGLRIITVGLGSREGATIPDPSVPSGAVEFNGQAVITRRDDPALSGIAKATGGSCITAEQEMERHAAVAELCMEYLKDISERENGDLMVQQGTEGYQWFLLPGFLCWVAVGLLAGGSSPPKEAILRKSSASASFISTSAIMIAFLLWAQSAYTEDSQSSALWQNETGERFNAAAEAFAAGNYRSAVDTLTTLHGTTAAESANNEMALGCALFRLARSIDEREPQGIKEKVDLLRSAAESFQRVLQKAPNDPIARTNLTVAVMSFRKNVLKWRQSEPRDDAAKEGGDEAAENQEASEKLEHKKKAGGESGGDASLIEPTSDDSEPSGLSSHLTKLEMAKIMESALDREQEYKALRRRRLERAGGLERGRDW